MSAESGPRDVDIQGRRARLFALYTFGRRANVPAEVIRDSGRGGELSFLRSPSPSFFISVLLDSLFGDSLHFGV